MMKMSVLYWGFVIGTVTSIHMAITAVVINNNNNDAIALIRNNSNTTAHPALSTVVIFKPTNITQQVDKKDDNRIVSNNTHQSSTISCACGVFLSGQLTKGKQYPQGEPVLLNESDEQCTCGAVGVKQCTNKCLDMIVKHLPNSPAIICASADRDCFKERAYLYVKNCNGNWISTNFSAGREYCCKDGLPYKCSKNKK